MGEGYPKCLSKRRQLRSFLKALWQEVRQRDGGREFRIRVALPENERLMHRSYLKVGGSRSSDCAFLESRFGLEIFSFSLRYLGVWECSALWVMQAV